MILLTYYELLLNNPNFLLTNALILGRLVNNLRHRISLICYYFLNCVIAKEFRLVFWTSKFIFFRDWAYLHGAYIKIIDWDWRQINFRIYINTRTTKLKLNLARLIAKYDDDNVTRCYKEEVIDTYDPAVSK